MRWRVLIGAVLLAGVLAWSGAGTTLAQERDGCTDTRFGGMGCMNDVRPFNYADPVVASNGWHLLRGGVVVIISHADMSMEIGPVNPPAAGSAASAPRDGLSLSGQYPGNNPRELYCIVFGRGC